MKPQTEISRAYHNGPKSTYDKLLDTTRWNGPNIEHNFYKCFREKREKAEKYEKTHKHEAFKIPARHVIEEQK